MSGRIYASGEGSSAERVPQPHSQYPPRTAGCTVHYVDAGMDTGEIIMQAHVPVLPDDTAQTLHARIQVQEHILYPAAILSAVARLEK